MKLMTTSIVLTLILACAAQGQPDFQVGNLNPPVESFEFLHTGQEAYAYLIYPPDQWTCTEGGFELLSVNMLLEFIQGQVPVDFAAVGGLAEAVWDPTLNAFVPGPQICEGPEVMFHAETSGQFTVMLPVDEACDCQIFDGHYFLTVRYLDAFEANLPIDDQPLAGVVYNDKGAGWVDMIDFDKTARGKVIIWGDTVCGTCSVGNESGTWSGIKSLYR